MNRNAEYSCLLGGTAVDQMSSNGYGDLIGCGKSQNMFKIVFKSRFLQISP